MLNQAIPGKLIVLFVGLLFLSYVAAETATAASSRKNAARGPGAEKRHRPDDRRDRRRPHHHHPLVQGAPLALDRMFYSQMRTYSVDSLITDSAPAATAFATGYKSNDKYVGIYPSEVTLPGLPPLKEEWKYRPLATVLEAAKASGKSVGLVATSNIQHASPAAYSAHTRDRGDYNEIAEQQVYLDIDVVFGGGKQYPGAGRPGRKKEGWGGPDRGS